MLTHGGAAAAAAAAERARRMQEEEEEMTPYSERDPHEFRNFLARRSRNATVRNEKWSMKNAKCKMHKPADILQFSSTISHFSFLQNLRVTQRFQTFAEQGALVFWVLFGVFAGVAGFIGLVIAIAR